MIVNKAILNDTPKDQRLANRITTIRKRFKLFAIVMVLLDEAEKSVSLGIFRWIIFAKDSASLFLRRNLGHDSNSKVTIPLYVLSLYINSATVWLSVWQKYFVFFIGIVPAVRICIERTGKYRWLQLFFFLFWFFNIPYYSSLL